MIDLSHLDKTQLHQINADYAQMERMGVLQDNTLLRQEIERQENHREKNSMPVPIGIHAMLLSHEACRILLYGKPRCP